MARICFPSLLHPNDRCYTIHNSSYDLDSRGQHHHLADWAGRYDTYGDGMVQHGPEYAAPEEDFGDYCGSLATFILAGGRDADEAAKMLADACWWNCTDRPSVEFAQTVKYKADKRQYFAKQDRKVSSASAKQYDKRWDEVQEWMDGGLSATFRLCLPGFAVGFLGRYATADFVVDTYSYEHGWHGSVADLLEFDDTRRKQWRAEDWSQAFGALNNVRESIRLRNHAKSTLSCWQNNAKVKMEEESELTPA